MAVNDKERKIEMLIESKAVPVYHNSLGNGKEIRNFNGDGIDIGNGWKTRNASTLAIQTQESVILMHNGGNDKSQVNILWVFQNIEKYKGKTICISVEARVCRLTENGGGGVLAFINAQNYNAGKFYNKTEFRNPTWEKIQLSVELTDEVINKGGLVCLRAVYGEPFSAVVEYRNFCINEEGKSDFGTDLHSHNLVDSWELVRRLILMPDDRKLFIENEDIRSDNRRKLFSDRCRQVLRGYRVANKIVSDDLSKHYFIMEKHIGDVMSLMKHIVIYKTFFSENFIAKDPEYKKYFGCMTFPKEIIIITSHLNSGAVKLYNSADDVIVLDNNELIDIGYYAKSGICTHFNLHRGDIGQYGDRIGIQEVTTVYKIGGISWLTNVPMKFPGKEDRMLSSQEIKEESINEAKKILKTHDIDACRMIILCPYAQSSSQMEEKYLQKAIEYFHKNDYLVFTNVGKNQVEMKNTKRLFTPVDVFVALGYMGATIIGVQSGIIDTPVRFFSTISVINIHLLIRPIDYKFMIDRKVSLPIDRKTNAVHMKIEPNELDDFSDKLIDVFKYNQKGHKQKRCFLDSMPPKQLLNAVDLNEYMKAVSEIKSCIVFMCVYDSANKYWDKVDTSLFGITSELGIAWRKSYVAVFDLENGNHYEEMRPNASFAIYQNTFEDIDEDAVLPKDNQYYLRSHAMGANHYTNSAIVINGQNYSLSGRGLNIVVYDKKKSMVLDSVYTGLWADSSLKVRRRDIDKKADFEKGER